MPCNFGPQTWLIDIKHKFWVVNSTRKSDRCVHINGTPLAKGPITRSMAKQIQEELATTNQDEAKILFTWTIIEHF